MGEFSLFFSSGSELITRIYLAPGRNGGGREGPTNQPLAPIENQTPLDADDAAG